MSFFVGEEQRSSYVFLGYRETNEYHVNFMSRKKKSTLEESLFVCVRAAQFDIILLV